MAARGRNPALHVVLLAGGSGTRFWPLSRADRPKQMLALSGGGPLLGETWKRVRALAPAARVWVVAPRHLERRVREVLPRLRSRNLILEPSPRDTAPAIALACATIGRQDPRAVVAVFPTDHVVRDAAAFAAAVRVAAGAAARGKLVCLGVRPDRPATGFGYLECRGRPRRGRAAAVRRFVEKPDRRRAEAFLRRGNYLWNAGMFVWGVERFLDELRLTEPAIRRAVESYLDGRARAWSQATRQSVDYAVMERARDVAVVPLEAGWDDVGSWDAAARLRAVGASRGTASDDVVSLDSPGSAVFGGRRLVALVDVPDIVVVDTEDALLVVARGKTEHVRGVVEELRRRGRKDLL